MAAAVGDSIIALRFWFKNKVLARVIVPASAWIFYSFCINSPRYYDLLL